MEMKNRGEFEHGTIYLESKTTIEQSSGGIKRAAISGRRLDSLDGDQDTVERPSRDAEEVTIGAGIDHIKLKGVVVFELLPLPEVPSDDEAVLPSTVAACSG